jgi:hypothetical protein
MPSSEIKPTEKKQKRDTVLIANFEDGFAKDWKMAVPEAFKESLDILFTDRKVKGVARKTWTQGRN